MITFINLYPGSTFGYCPKCKCTCEPELFLESDGASRLVCVRCLGKTDSLDRDVVEDDEEDDYDQESAAAYERWWQGNRFSARSGLAACNAHDCHVHTGGRCFVCQQPSCKEHLTANGRCPDCEHVANLLN